MKKQINKKKAKYESDQFWLESQAKKERITHHKNDKNFRYNDSCQNENHQGIK